MVAGALSAVVDQTHVGKGGFRVDIFDRLSADHLTQRELAVRILQAPAGAVEISRWFDMLCDEIEAHNAAEEHTFLAALLARSNEQDMIRHSVDEHDEAAVLIAELSDIEIGSEDWRAGMVRLAETLEHHFAEEEDEVFAVARPLLDDNLAVVLGDSFARSKDNWIEVYGRVPLSRQPEQVVVPRNTASVARRAAGLLLHGRPGGLFRRWRRPLREAKTVRFSGTSRSPDTMPPTKSGSTG